MRKRKDVPVTRRKFRKQSKRFRDRFCRSFSSFKLGLGLDQQRLSGIDYYYPDDAKRLREWLETSGLEVVSCDDDTHFSMFDGVLTECITYYCTPKNADVESAPRQ